MPQAVNDPIASQAVEGPARFGRLVGGSGPMQRLYGLLERAAASDATVLLEGETGTGKEVTAQSIHEASTRAGGPFIVVDCGAIPGNLLESELFGYERGAFTGATGPRAGAFEAANGGTIFLDEIGELELELQPKILRALESRRIKRLGTAHYTPIDVRVVAATNRSLREEVKAGRFRSDLYYRLAVLPMKLPPVRDRREDIPLLVEEILTQLGQLHSREAPAVRHAKFLEVLSNYRWPGNVRQLRNYIERRLALGTSVPLPGADSLMPPAMSSAMRMPAGANLAPPAAGFSIPTSTTPPAVPEIRLDLPLKAAREAWNAVMEARYLQALLDRHENNVAAAARAAGVNRVHFYRLLWKHGLRESDSASSTNSKTRS